MCLPYYLHQVCIPILFIFVIHGVFGEDQTVDAKDKRLVMHMDGEPAIGLLQTTGYKVELKINMF